MATRKKVEGTPAAEKAGAVPGAAVDGAAAVVQTQADAQMKALEQGLRLFRAQQFAEARVFFEHAAKGPQLPVTLTAKNHVVVCDRRMQKPLLALKTASDHYHYGVERLNARDLETARKHLEVALALDPKCDYMLYGYAAALALSGDISGAYENLRRAVDADPRNRNAARQDPDFASVAHTPLFAQLLHPERSQPF